MRTVEKYGSESDHLEILCRSAYWGTNTDPKQSGSLDKKMFNDFIRISHLSFWNADFVLAL